MKQMLIVMFASMLVACGQKAVQDEKFGSEITLTEKTPVSAILAAPEDFVGKKVLVEGTVLEVCSKAGCWMEVSGDQPEQKIKVKVKDGEIVFPMTAKGRTATVEGEVYKIDMTQEEAMTYMSHLAEEKGVAFDSTSVTGPMTLYQIKGMGAVVAAK